MAYQGLIKVEFGHIAAEEEATDLQQYFVETKEYSDVLSDKKKILVIGRKGSGKSAIYVAIRDLNSPARQAAQKKRTPETKPPIELYRNRCATRTQVVSGRKKSKLLQNGNTC